MLSEINIRETWDPVTQLSYRQAKRPRVQAVIPYHTIFHSMHSFKVLLCLEHFKRFVWWDWNNCWPNISRIFNMLPSSAKPKLEALSSGLAEVSFIFIVHQPTNPPPPRESTQTWNKAAKTIPNQTKPHQWKITSMEDNLNGRWPRWKTT